MSEKAGESAQVFVRINQQSVIADDKLHLNLDIVAVKDGKVVPHQKVVLDIDGKRKVIITQEEGEVESYDVIFQIQKTRVQLRAFIDEKDVAKYDLVLDTKSDEKDDDLKDVSPENRDLIKKLKQQYDQMVVVLNHFKIPSTGMPDWKKISQGLNMEDMELVRSFREPMLLLISPESRAVKINALDSNRGLPGQNETFVCDLTNVDYWNESKKENVHPIWRVGIVEGTEEVEINPEFITPGRICEIISGVVQKYQEAGFDIVNDADTYLTLMMVKNYQRKYIDVRYRCLLNGKNLKSEYYTYIAYGKYNRRYVKGKETGNIELSLYQGMYFDFGPEQFSQFLGDLRLRPIVWISLNE